MSDEKLLTFLSEEPARIVLGSRWLIVDTDVFGSSIVYTVYGREPYQKKTARYYEGNDLQVALKVLENR